jgi:hypothetical protein
VETGGGLLGCADVARLLGMTTAPPNRESDEAHEHQANGDSTDSRDQPRQHEAVVQDVLADPGRARAVELDGRDDGRAIGDEEIAKGEPQRR